MSVRRRFPEPVAETRRHTLSLARAHRKESDARSMHAREKSKVSVHHLLNKTVELLFLTSDYSRSTAPLFKK